MKPSISKKTQAYLDALAAKSAAQPDFHYDKMDALDTLIFEKNLRIQKVYVEKPLDLIIVLLNNRKLITRPLSDFPRLKNADENALMNLHCDGIDIHWPELDEDLSLKGFLVYDLAHGDARLAG